LNPVFTLRWPKITIHLTKKILDASPWLLICWRCWERCFAIFRRYGIAHRARRCRIPAKKADVIAIFGAAEYAGHPSPVYKARLDHGLRII
jgi:hypothetical protein